MKLFIVICAVALVGLSVAEEEEAYGSVHPRGCIYIMGKCSRDCEEGTHAYALGCGYKTPEATCDEPNPVAENFMMCDYSACYCDPPTVRDTTTDKCVQLSDCPKKQ